MVHRRRTKAVVIAERMLEAIKSGKYDLDGKLPSVRALVMRLGMSDKTVRSAYAILERAGYVSKRPGVGTALVRRKASA